MVLQRYDMGSASFTSGITRDVLRQATFDQITSFRGVRRAMILSDLERFDIRAYVRVNPEVLKRFKPKQTSLDVGFQDYLDGPLTSEWVAVKPSIAVRLWYDMREDVTLGAPSVAMTMMDDGNGGKMSIPQSTQGFPGLIEFKMACEIDKKETT